jgi:hypothetical protein
MASQCGGREAYSDRFDRSNTEGQSSDDLDKNATKMHNPAYVFLLINDEIERHYIIRRNELSIGIILVVWR